MPGNNSIPPLSVVEVGAPLAAFKSIRKSCCQQLQRSCPIGCAKIANGQQPMLPASYCFQVYSFLLNLKIPRQSI